jgi:hypothetical protein
MSIRQAAKMLPSAAKSPRPGKKMNMLNGKNKALDSNVSFFYQCHVLTQKTSHFLIEMRTFLHDEMSSESPINGA